MEPEITCPLCSIPGKERLIYSDDLVFLVNTKDLKGHNVRVMAALKRHSTTPSFEERSRAYFLVFAYMMRRGERWCLVSDAFASVKSHWHLVACSLESSDRKETMLLSKTPKVIVNGGLL